MCIYIYICIYIFVYIYIYICISLSISLSLYIYIYISISISLSLYIYIYIYIYTHIHINTVPEAAPCSCSAVGGASFRSLKIHQRGLQWKQGAVVYIILQIVALNNTTPCTAPPSDCTPLCRVFRAISNSYKTTNHTSSNSSNIHIFLIIIASLRTGPWGLNTRTKHRHSFHGLLNNIYDMYSIRHINREQSNRPYPG